MDIYLSDDQYRPDIIIDQYETLVWTERWSSYGDFTLTMKESKFMTTALTIEKYIVSPQSKLVMMVETLSIEEQRNGENLIKISGRDLSAFFENRHTKTDRYRDPEVYPGTAGGLPSVMVYKYAIDPGTAGPVNVLPGLEILPGVEFGPYVWMVIDRDNLYSLVKALCDSARLGFELARFVDGSGLLFTVKESFDRTDPTSSSYKMYTPDDGSLVGVKTLSSISTYKNHARVLGNKTGVDVYAPGTDPSVSGWQRRTIVVDANDIGSAADATDDPEDPDDITTIEDDQKALKQRGLEVLAEQGNKYVLLVDGILPQGPDSDEEAFLLGSIVHVKDTYQNISKMRIVEAITTQDKTGVKRTPTFEIYA